MVCMLLSFAISGESQDSAMAKQNGNEDEAARRMGSYIRGSGCKGLLFSQFVCCFAHYLYSMNVQIVAQKNVIVNADFPLDNIKLH